MKPLARVAAASCAVLLTSALAACGSTSTSSASSAAASGASAIKALSSVNPSAPEYAALPDSIKKAGKITLGSEIGYPPMEYYDADGKTILGFDKTLSDILSNKLGVPINWSNSNFDGLITELQSGKIDMVMASMMDNKTREAKVDFVDYYSESSVILTQAANPDKISSVDDLCGKTVGVQRGTTQNDVLDKQTKTCTDAGKQAINILPFDKESDALLQVKQGRASATIEQNAVAAYNISTTGKTYAIQGGVIPNTSSPVGIAVTKENTQLRDAIQKALQSAMDDGSYLKALQQYGLEKGKQDSPKINGATA